MNVIVASGPGASAVSLENLPEKLDVDQNISIAKESGEYVDAVAYMTKVQDPGRIVLVYGGSATASWAVAHAKSSQARAIIWANRKGQSQIEDEGNPIGRNQEIIDYAVQNKLLVQGEIKKIRIDTTKKAFDGRLSVTLKISGVEKTLEVDQLVYATGADPLGAFGPGNILSTTIKSRLEPIWDNNGRFNQTPLDRVRETPNPDAVSVNSGKVAIALKDKEGQLWVVGAAVFRGLGLTHITNLIGSTATNSRYANAGNIIAAGGRPPEGIAIVDMTINALTGFRQSSNPFTFNWNKANRRDIFMMLSDIYAKNKEGVRIPYSVREKISEAIVAKRAKTSVGLSQPEVVDTVRWLLLAAHLPLTLLDELPGGNVSGAQVLVGYGSAKPTFAKPSPPGVGPRRLN